MALHAKPSGGYTIGSDDWNGNVKSLWAFCHNQGYTEEAFAGMIGNACAESGLNPWRWQSDKVNYSNGYGLFQYTPASGYINIYGRTSTYFAPNLSTTETTSSARVTDAYAQIDCISASGKYVSGTRRNNLLLPYVSDCTDYNTIDTFKTVTSVEKATYLWLGYFECPGWWLNQKNVSSNFEYRKSAADSVYNLITGSTADEPDEPIPSDPDNPTPNVPVSQTHKMPIYMMIRRRF